MKFLKKNIFIFLSIAFIFSVTTTPVLAAGNIDAVQKYSQFRDVDLDNNGTKDFINWSPTLSDPSVGATVSDSAITGNIWGETVGWINLGPFNSSAGPAAGVKNTCSGILSGFAWGQNTGWINFAPSMATGPDQPKINTTTGVITGSVWSQNYGWITLNSGNGSFPGLKTSWAGCSSVTPPPTGTPPTLGSGGCTLPKILINGICQIPATPVPGCIDPAATNFNTRATASDGSCRYSQNTNPVLGCMDNAALNYKSSATVSDGSCNYPINPVTPPNPVVQPSTGPGVNPPLPGVGPRPLSNTVSGSRQTISGIIGMPSFDNFMSFKNLQSMGPLALIVAILGLLSSIPGLITRFGNLLLAFLFAKKKKRGIVFDASSKEPLDPAYVSVINTVTGQEVANQITDMEGRFGFVLKKGSYRLTAGKTHYQFPSALLAGKTSDEVYTNLYFGDTFIVENEDEITEMNIPMDPLGTDWNQQEKRRMNILKYLITNEKTIARIFNILFSIGFAVSLIIAFYYPVWFNLVVVGLYVVILIIRVLGYGPISAGKITKSGIPLKNGVVRVYSASLDREISHKVTSESGSYFILTSKADYYLTIEEKNADGTYTKVFTSEVMKAKNGLINKSFDL